MDGNNRQQIVTRNVGSPMSVVVDNPTGLGGRIYWTDSFHGVIETADLQGGNRVNLISKLCTKNFVCTDNICSTIFENCVPLFESGIDK